MNGLILGFKVALYKQTTNDSHFGKRYLSTSEEAQGQFNVLHVHCESIAVHSSRFDLIFTFIGCVGGAQTDVCVVHSVVLTSVY